MGMVTTEAWVLYQNFSGKPETAELQKEVFSFPDITEYEVLAEPIYGCWEGNMTHALERDPVDICHQRSEEKIVLGNAGIVRILKKGNLVTTVQEGDLCVLAPTASWDRFGYLLKVFAYDAPGTVGLLAKKVKMHEKQVAPLPKNTKYSLQQWAGVSVRYFTAWSNWKVAYGCWRLQMSEADSPQPFVWGWGGGVTLAELTLAKFFGCRVAMIASTDERIKQIQELGIQPINRRQFRDLNFDEQRYQSDRAYKKSYIKAEKAFINLVMENTERSGISILIDNIGKPVFRASLRSLSRQGIITTVGWKCGMETSINRAVECIDRHIHVFTHGARLSEVFEVIDFSEKTGWLPPPSSEEYSWDEIPQLAQDYAKGNINSYFPIFQVNPL